MECIPHVDRQVCRTLSCTEDTMFTMMGKIISQFSPRRSLSYIYFEQSELVKGHIGDSVLISSFLRYIDDLRRKLLRMKMHSPTLMMNVWKYFWGSLAIAIPTVYLPDRTLRR